MTDVPRPPIPYVVGPSGPPPPPTAMHRPAPPTPPRVGGPLLFGLGGLAVGLILGALCGGAIAGKATSGKVVAAEPAATVYVTVYVTPAAATPTSDAPSPASATAPAPVTEAARVPTPAAKVVTIDDGSWTVGEDVPAGTYKTVGAGSDCYWGIYKSGTNQGTIVDNHIGGGNLRVTLKAGQDFETVRCGVWSKV